MPARVLIVFFSTQGHVWELVQSAVAGIAALGAEAAAVTVRRIADGRSLEERARTVGGRVTTADLDGADGAWSSVPVATEADFRAADGIIFAFPVYFASMPGVMKSALDELLNGLWFEGALMTKPCTVLCSSGGQGTGAESAALGVVALASSLGMLFVPAGPSSRHRMSNAAATGGSLYGGGAIAGPHGERAISEAEAELAGQHAARFAVITRALVAGRQAVGEEQYKVALGDPPSAFT